jgi:hypothetical protein
MSNPIRQFFLRQIRKMRFLPSKLYVNYHYEYFTGKKLDLNNPEEFNAKIEWYKVFYRPQILNQLVDKYAVRKFVEEKIGAKYLNEVYDVYETAEDIPLDELPNQFVVKATHTSSHNLIVSDKNKLNKEKAVKKFKKWLSKNQYYRIGQEWAYKDVQPRLIAEKFLKEDGKQSLVDYKYYCFDGEAKFIDVHIDRDEDHKQGCFDLNYNLLPFGKSKNYKSISEGIEKPSNLDEMTQCAETLAKGLPFVRVDFYSVNGKTIFGEMTFYPSDARKDFYPEEYNKIIGDYFKLPPLKNGNEIITEFNQN